MPRFEQPSRSLAPAAGSAVREWYHPWGLWPTALDQTVRNLARSWPGAIVSYLFVAAFACFLGLGKTDSVSMEGMVADAARNMVRTGDWIVPRIYGEVYTYKPALAYWLAAIPYLATDHPSELLLRLPFAACGLLMGLVVLLLIGRVSGPKIGFLSAAASITATAYVQKAQVGEFDVVVTAGVGVAVAAACFNLCAPKPRPAIWLLAYLGLAFGFLAKGTPALMAYGPGLLLAALLNRRLRLLVRWDHLVGGILFLALAGSYVWAGYAAEGAVFFEQPIEEARIRGLEWTWQSFALTFTKPAIIWAVLLPWTVVLPFLLADRSWLRAQASDARLIRASVGFLAGGTLAFMATPAHQVRYYLPLCVSAGILCGVTLGRKGELGPAWRRRRAQAVVALAAAAACGAALAGIWLSIQRIPLQNGILLVLVGLAGAASVRWLARDRERHLAALLLVAALCVATAENFGYRPHRSWKRGLRSVAQAFQRVVPENEPVWVLGPADMAGKNSSLYFYFDRPVRAFRHEASLPPNGSYCVFDSRELEELRAAQESGVPLPFSFQSTFAHPYSNYYLVRATMPPRPVRSVAVGPERAPRPRADARAHAPPLPSVTR